MCLQDQRAKPARFYVVEHKCPNCGHLIRRKEADSEWLCFDLSCCSTKNNKLEL